MWIQKTLAVISAVVLFNAGVRTVNGCPLNCECSPIDGSNSHIYAKCDNLDIFDDSTFADTIKYVNISNSKLKQLTKNLDKFNLVGIDLSNNYLSKLTKFSDDTKYLNLSHNQLVSDSIFELPLNVEELNLSFNKITTLPIDLMKLKNLRDLDIYGNEINCTCETIEVRNWLLGNGVNIARPIRCSSPFQFKDKPWKSVKMTQACKMLNEDFMDGNPIHDSDNYLMVNDQNVISDNPTENDEDELGKYYLLADHKKISDATLMDHDEGSGGGGSRAIDHLDMQEASGDNILELDDNDEEVDEDYSGSGGGLADFEGPIMRKYNKPVESADRPMSTTEKTLEENTQPINWLPDQIDNEEPFKYQLGIMKNFEEQSKTTHSSVPDTIDTVADPMAPKADGVQDGSRKGDISSPPEADLSQASAGGSSNTSDDTNTYILLGVILVLVVGIIIFVGIKRNRSSRSGVRPKSDDHQKGTELVYMKTRDPEKPPAEKYKIPEKTPLIEEVKKIDEKNNFADPKKDDDRMIKQPLLKDDDNKDGVLPEQRNGLKESNNNATEPIRQQEAPKLTETAPSKDKPVTPNPTRTESYPPPKTKTESPYPSPRPSRYSPVYSPETGRVKIKLAETPKPKTPQLITRTSANGGANISDTSAVP